MSEKQKGVLNGFAIIGDFVFVIRFLIMMVLIEVSYHELSGQKWIESDDPNNNLNCTHPWEQPRPRCSVVENGVGQLLAK